MVGSSMTEFESAVREWHALLRDGDEAVALRHFDTAMRLAVALHCQQDVEAAAATASLNGSSKADEQLFTALALVLRRVLEVVVRDHMTFLLPSNETQTASGTGTGSASHKVTLAQHQALTTSLPSAFRERFRLLLQEHWEVLTQAATTTKFSLPRLQAFDWTVAVAASSSSAASPPLRRILVRLQTSDGKTQTLQVPMRQFHQLRHSVATVLQEMNQVESHPMMRLAYMEQSSQ
ncbi:hypothetical protein BBJ28_00012610 [Nothophytophthora sp. Chile5]|nr:hypothetical protein BBJ28_00012610 [Nothophytophthora sp. Chile5]